MEHGIKSELIEFVRLGTADHWDVDQIAKPERVTGALLVSLLTIMESHSPINWGGFDRLLCVSRLKNTSKCTTVV